MQRYVEAGRALSQVLSRTAGLKTATLGDGVKGKRTTYALVCETLKYLHVIRDICKAVPSLVKNKTVGKRPAMLYVMLYDHLFGKGIKGGGAVKRVIKENAAA
eukprot:CAMPEP_0203832884 /NCGR_PEP_ID=MMETSP0115-20131106/71834_1 /ASSEMBLY_ACC=CAM_ASM_000227 /TAXON_ID=33651 /ORGANISM="Bicosoecid sp, Strain ms1" /LENGTH=102 /DNA_ID=CAMNT_0050741953 /DNA_START=51 /DNA_END=356 /DNA_ORIENTATION=-